MFVPGIIVVTRPTRMQGLLGRWGTRGQAKYLFKRKRLAEFAKRLNQKTISDDDSDIEMGFAEVEEDAELDFSELESEDATYQKVLESLRHELRFDLPVQFIDRTYLPTYNFGIASVVVVVGQDGLVANTAKYVGELPIVAVNPDPARIDGVLLPFQVKEARSAVNRVLNNKARTRSVTLAQVSLNDGQRLLAFNDLFIGSKTHVSARYQLTANRQTEPQSSSGILVSTGAGSTGWLSSMINMANGLGTFLDPSLHPSWRMPLRWEDRQLVWIVREPFISKTSQAQLVAGRLQPGQELVIESQMSSDGVIFSDGVEQDFLNFTSGTIATISVADQSARLVVR
jgi:NAD kinase